jgi:hypothetical protein
MEGNFNRVVCDWNEGGYLLHLLNCREKCSPEREKQIGMFFTPAHLHFAAKTNVSPVGQLQIILWPRSKD